MIPPRVFVLAALAALGTSGCVIGDVSTNTTGSGDAGTKAAPPSGDSDVDALFAALAAPTAGKLVGVWSTTSKAATGDAELRLRISQGVIVAGVRCTYPSSASTILVAGAKTTARTADFEATSGTLQLGTILTFQKSSGGLDCQGQVPDVSLVFSITGTTMLLAGVESGTQTSLTKIGD